MSSSMASGSLENEVGTEQQIMVPHSAEQKADTQKIAESVDQNSNGLRRMSIEPVVSDTSGTITVDGGGRDQRATKSESADIEHAENEGVKGEDVERVCMERDGSSSGTSKPAVSESGSNRAGASTSTSQPALPAEREGLEIEKQRLEIERERLEIERERLAIERERAGRELAGRERLERERAGREKAERDLLERERVKWLAKGQTTEKQMNALVDLKYDLVGDTPEERRRKRVLRKALKESKETVQNLEGKVERRNKQIDGFKFEIYQLVGLFSVFSGVVFAAVTQPNRLEIPHLWSPLALTGYAFVVVAFITFFKFRSVESLEKDNHAENEASKDAKKLINGLQRCGHYSVEEFEFTKYTYQTYKPRHKARNVTLVVLFLFLLLLWGSFLHIIITKSPR